MKRLLFRITHDQLWINQWQRVRAGDIKAATDWITWLESAVHWRCSLGLFISYTHLKRVLATVVQPAPVWRRRWVRKCVFAQRSAWRHVGRQTEFTTNSAGANRPFRQSSINWTSDKIKERNRQRKKEGKEQLVDYCFFASSIRGGKRFYIHRKSCKRHNLCAYSLRT